VAADFSDRTDFDNANRGLIARLEPGQIKDAQGRVVYDADIYAQATAGDCPGTARRWSRYLAEAVELFADDADVAFASHHWPT